MGIPPSKDRNADTPVPKPLENIYISVRGSRRTGKTSLISKMEGRTRISVEYSQTPRITITNIVFRPDKELAEKIIINVFDCVDKAINYSDDEVDDSPKDATEFNTFDVDGVIVMYDKRDIESVKYATQVLLEAPKELPLIVLSNFADRHTDHTIPKDIKRVIEKNNIMHVDTSMLTNQGLEFLAKWVNITLLYHRKLLYEKKLKIVNGDMMLLCTNLQNELSNSMMEAEKLSKTKEADKDINYFSMRGLCAQTHPRPEISDMFF